MKTIIVSRGVIQSNGKLLVIQNKRLGSGKWCLPGGKAESTETPIETLERELNEELGVRGDVGKLLYVHQLFNNGSGERTQRLEFFFLVNNPDEFLGADLQQSSHGVLEANDIAWLSPGEAEILPAFLNQMQDASLIQGTTFIKNYA